MSDVGIKIPNDRELIFDWPAIDAAMTRMAAEITADLAGERPIYMTILTGGLLIGGCLAPRIDLDLIFDYAHATRYRGATEGGALQFKKPYRDFG